MLRHSKLPRANVREGEEHGHAAFPQFVALGEIDDERLAGLLDEQLSEVRRAGVDEVPVVHRPAIDGVHVEIEKFGAKNTSFGSVELPHQNVQGGQAHLVPLRVQEKIELVERQVSKLFRDIAGLRHCWPQEPIALAVTTWLGFEKPLQVGYSL